MNDSRQEGMHDVELKPGDVLAGKFRIERVLGRGGMGVVVQAMHLHLDQRVALKFLLPDALIHPETLARFSREARAAAKIKSEHVARVIDVGTLDSGSPYIVMEYLEGEDLSAHLRKNGPLSMSQATGFVLQACEALAEAHAAGIVHRDLKPANLFLARYPDGAPCVKILDFGISKISSGESGRDFDMTRTTAIMGSPFYMSPEQMKSTRSVDARADIWALGVILYELVSQRLPFDADTMPQLCALVLQEEPAPLGSFAQGGSPTFEAVVLRCLEKHPARRFQSIADLADALAPFAPHEAQRSLDLVARLSGAPSAPRSGSSSKVAAPVVAGAVSAESATQTDFGRTARGHGGSRRLLIGVALSLGGLVGAAGWLLSRPTATTAASAAPAPRAHTPASATEREIVPAPAPSAPTVATVVVPSASVASPPTAASPKPAPALVSGARQKARRPAAQAPAPAAPAPAAPAPAAPAPAAPARPPGALDGRL